MMIPKLPDSKNKKLIIIQFLGENEVITGFYMSEVVNQSSPYIEEIKLIESSNAEDLLKKIQNEIPDIIDENTELVVYIDTHGNFPSMGICHDNGFISSEELVEALRKATEKLSTPPVLISTACYGIAIREILEKYDHPIVSKLIAGDGIMHNGPMLHAFRELFDTKGFAFDSKDIAEINIYLKERAIQDRSREKIGPNHKLGQLQYIDY